MTRRPVPSELIWSEDPADADLPIAWAVTLTARVLDWVWRAFDSLRVNHLAQLDLNQELEQMERDLTRMHFVQIQVLFVAETTGHAAFVPFYEWPELETRSPAPAKPPTYDFAFICSANNRWAWPIEAKVVSSAGALAEYLRDVNIKFCRGIAAPLVGEGAMIGYLLVNEPTKVFANLASKLNQNLESSQDFPARPHRISHHDRSSAPSLRLHHLLMVCAN